MRKAVVAQLKSHAGDYEVFVTEPYQAYLSRMARDGTWGDHLSLQARPASLARKEPEGALV